MMDKSIVACALLLAAGYAWMTEQVATLPFGDPLGPKAFPRILSAALVICALLLLIELFLAKRSGKTGAVAPGATTSEPPGGIWITAATATFTGLYFFLFEPLGFVLSSSVYLLVMTTVFNPGRLRANALVSLLLPITCYLVFTHVLGVELARGILPL